MKNRVLALAAAISLTFLTACGERMQGVPLDETVPAASSQTTASADKTEEITAIKSVSAISRSASTAAGETDISAETAAEAAADSNTWENTYAPGELGAFHKWFQVETQIDDNGVQYIDSSAYPADLEEMLLYVRTSQFKDDPRTYDEQQYLNMDNYFIYTDFNIENIKDFPNLKRLAISTSGALDISPECSLINYEALSELTDLEYICFDGVNLDCGIADCLSSVRSLEIQRGSSATGEFVSKFSQIKELVLWRCQIENLSFVDSMTSLETLRLEQAYCINCINGIPLNGASYNTTLKNLILPETSVTDLYGIACFSSLENLYVDEYYFQPGSNEEEQLHNIKKLMPELNITVHPVPKTIIKEVK